MTVLVWAWLVWQRATSFNTINILTRGSLSIVINTSLPIRSVVLPMDSFQPVWFFNSAVPAFLVVCVTWHPETFTPYGFTHIHLWNREEGNPGCRERKYKKLPAELKESYCWSESIDKTADLIGEDVLITMLSDPASQMVARCWSVAKTTSS